VIESDRMVSPMTYEHFHKICLICDVIQGLKGIAAKCEGHFSKNQQKQLLQLEDQRVKKKIQQMHKPVHGNSIVTQKGFS